MAWLPVPSTPSSRSLFKADRLTFAMHFVHGMYPDQWGKGEWEGFLGLLVDGGGGGDEGGGGGAPGWVAEDRRQAVLKLRASFPDLYRELNLDDANMWSGFAGAEECETDFPVQVMSVDKIEINIGCTELHSYKGW